MTGTFFDWLRHVGRGRDLKSGRRGEDLAHRYLRRQGFTIVARNYRLAAGDAEVDLIARDGEALVFVEVKSRETGEYGPPERAIGEEKRRHLSARRARIFAQNEYTLGTGKIRRGDGDSSRSAGNYSVSQLPADFAKHKKYRELPLAVS